MRKNFRVTAEIWNGNLEFPGHDAMTIYPTIHLTPCDMADCERMKTKTKNETFLEMSATLQRILDNSIVNV